jgi:uncharacterized protein
MSGEHARDGDVEIQQMIADACLTAGSEEEFTRDLRGYLEARGVPAADVDEICAAPPRLALYRRLVRNNLAGVTQRMMPRARARVNDVNGAFDAEFDAFLEERAPRTHYLRDVPAEFLAWVAPRWKARADLPAYAADLAAHELVEFEICAAPVPAEPPPLADVALDRALVFTEAKRVMRYGHAVHLLPADEDDRTTPETRPVTLLAYRDTEDAARFLELSPLAGAIVERLIAGEPLGTALAGACAALGYTLDDAILADTARLLADLGERGVLLGAKA